MGDIYSLPIAGKMPWHFVVSLAPYAVVQGPGGGECISGVLGTLPMCRKGMDHSVGL